MSHAETAANRIADLPAPLVSTWARQFVEEAIVATKRDLFLTMPEPPLDVADLDGLQAYAEAIAQWRADCGYPLRYDGPVG